MSILIQSFLNVVIKEIPLEASPPLANWGLSLYIKPVLIFTSLENVFLWKSLSYHVELRIRKQPLPIIKSFWSLTLAGPFVVMPLIFDRNNKVSPVCILIDLEMASSENPTVNLDPIHSKGGNLGGGKPSIRGRRDVLTATNRPARSKWKFVAVFFAITMAFSVIVAALLSGKYLLDYFGDTSNKCKCWFLVFLKGKGVFEWWKSCGQNLSAPMSYFHFRRKVNALVISFPYQFKVRDCRRITYRVRKTNRAKYDDLQHAGLV